MSASLGDSVYLLLGGRKMSGMPGLNRRCHGLAPRPNPTAPHHELRMSVMGGAHRASMTTAVAAAEATAYTGRKVG